MIFDLQLQQIILVVHTSKLSAVSKISTTTKGHLPGNSVRETGDKMKGGAVKDDRSPENEAILNQICREIIVTRMRVD